MQNAPNPDVNTPTASNDSDTDIERKNEETPTPPDRSPNVPVEEPPETNKPAIEDDSEKESPRIL